MDEVSNELDFLHIQLCPLDAEQCKDEYKAWNLAQHFSSQPRYEHVTQLIAQQIQPSCAGTRKVVKLVELELLPEQDEANISRSFRRDTGRGGRGGHRGGRGGRNGAKRRGSRSQNKSCYHCKSTDHHRKHCIEWLATPKGISWTALQKTRSKIKEDSTQHIYTEHSALDP